MKKISLLAVFTISTLVSTAQTLKDAIKLNENEQQESAGIAYQNLITAQPTNGTNYYYFGENFIDSDKLDSAKLVFDKGLIVDPTNQLNTIGLAELKILQGKLDEGKVMIGNAVKATSSKNVIVLAEAAEALIKYKEKDLMTAQLYLDAAIKIEPKNAELYNLMGDIYSEQNNGTQAAINYNKALELDPKQVKSLLHKGQLYKRSTNYDGAAIEFQNALAIDPNFAPAYRELGEVSFRQRKLEKAKEYYKKYLELSKNNTTARLRYAYFLYESGNYNEALNELNLIPKIDSTHLNMMRILGYVAFEASKNDTSLQAMRKVFEITQSDTTRRLARDYSYYGRALYKSGNDSLGASYVQTALTIDPKQPELYDDLADLYNKAKKYDLAAKTYEAKVTNITKTTTADYFNFGKALYFAKNYVKADSVFTKVTELNPTWPTGYFWRGRANAQQDVDMKLGLATPHYSKYVELAVADTVNFAKYKTNLIESNSALAFAAYVQKDCKKSIEYWNQVLALDANIKQAKDAIESIKVSKDCK